MQRLATRASAATLLGAVLFSVSGSVAVASSPAGQAADTKLCTALTKVGSLDARFNEALVESDSWDEALDELERLGPKINKAWRTVVRRIPDELEEAATLVAGFTKRALVKLAETDSLDEAGALITDDPGAIAAGVASLELDAFSRETCDVSINNG